MAGARRIILPYKPRRLLLPFHDRTQRWAVIVAHRRFGKTIGSLVDMIKRAVTLPLPHGRFAFVAPFLAQAKETAWDYLKRYAKPITAGTNESELWVELINGARIRIHGADNPDRLRGAYLDGAVLDEYADMRPGVWGEVIRPMLADRHGWATFIGTPKGRNAFYELFAGAQTDPAWYWLILRASETDVLPQVELDDARQSMTAEQYEQEFECSFDAAILGAYFGKELAEADRAGRIRDVPYDPALPVYTSWDLGKGANMSVWIFQVGPDGPRFIDHHEGSHSDGLPQVVSDLNAKGYPYAIDWVPHDAKAVALDTGRTRVETLTILTKRVPQLVPDHKVMDGINAARLMIPKCYIDGKKCANAIEALRQYRADYDEKSKVFKDVPKHDWTSHTADAFRYAAMAWREVKPVIVKPIRKQQIGEVFLPGAPVSPSGIKIRI